MGTEFQRGGRLAGISRLGSLGYAGGHDVDGGGEALGATARLQVDGDVVTFSDVHLVVHVVLDGLFDLGLVERDLHFFHSLVACMRRMRFWNTGVCTPAWIAATASAMCSAFAAEILPL